VTAQSQNKERAFAILRARLFDLEVQKQQAEIYAKRKMQVSALSHRQGWKPLTGVWGSDGPPSAPYSEH
jgi:hypothetical protein